MKSLAVSRSALLYQNACGIPANPAKLCLQTLWKQRSDYAMFKWSPEVHKTKFHIVAKKGGAVRTIEAPFNYMGIHYSNSFESADGKEIYLDTADYKDPTILDHLYLDHLHNSKQYVKNTLS